jgi:5-(hydroxymethyl)furfural/furfural oxidase
VFLCEAGQDTPPGTEPKEIAGSYSGTAYFDPRFHWTYPAPTPTSRR